MSALDLLLVGPAERSTGGVAQFLGEQRRHLPGDVRATVHDDGTVDGEFASDPLDATRRTLDRLAALPARDPPDVVHVHSSHGLSFYRAAAYVLYARTVWDAGVVLHVHGSSFDDFVAGAGPAARRVQSVVFDAADAVIVLSAYWRRALADLVPERKLWTVPNAVDAERYAPATDAGDAAVAPAASDGPPTVAFVSNHVPRKGIVDLVEALDRLRRERDVAFDAVLAGDGPAAEHAMGLADRYDCVEYAGYVSEAEKRSILAEASIYALPSHAEGLPIGLLEGMAGANAVVSTDVGSVPEVVGEENGRLVTPGDVDALTEALASLLGDPETVAEMGRSNRRLVRRRYSWSAVTERLLEVYDAVDGGAATEATPVPPRSEASD